MTSKIKVLASGLEDDEVLDVLRDHEAASLRSAEEKWHQNFNLEPEDAALFAFKVPPQEDTQAVGMLAAMLSFLRERASNLFVLGVPAAESPVDPRVRAQLLQNARVNMISRDPVAIAGALDRLAAQAEAQGDFDCPFCACKGLSEPALSVHVELFHMNVGCGVRARCSVCKSKKHELRSHIVEEHGTGPVEDESEHVRLPTFALIVCRNPRDGRFLLVQEKGVRGYWLPGGGVDRGERLEAAAVRETKEEAGVDVDIKGILGIQYTPLHDHERLRVIFYAEPRDPDQFPKSLPDRESQAAIYVRAEDVGAIGDDGAPTKRSLYPLRGPEPTTWFNYVANGGTIHDLSIGTEF